MHELAQLAVDTLVVEEGGRRATLIDLLELRGRTEAECVDRAVLKLRMRIEGYGLKQIKGVEMLVKSRCPSDSLAVAKLRVDAMRDFVHVTRQSQGRQSGSSPRHAPRTPSSSRTPPRNGYSRSCSAIASSPDRLSFPFSATVLSAT